MQTVTSEHPVQPKPKRRQLKFEEFAGESVLAAEQHAREVLGDRLLGTDVVRDVGEKTTTGRGETPDEALAAVMKRIPKEAIARGEGRVIQEGDSGMTEVAEHSEFEARRLARSQAPKGAQLNTFTCTEEPKKGTLGLGKKPGTWSASWSIPFVAEVSYTLPAVVTARFFG